ncbi:hypothetical protein KY346_00840 [Candidatus Woesearchaeota archaeon]|nr:hypothetical protein [Candidatus Woesearchaeota archaeon]
MQNIIRIKEVLNSLSALRADYMQCEDLEKLSKDLSSVKANLLKTYDNTVSERFASLDSELHLLFRQHFSSLILSIGDLQKMHVQHRIEPVYNFLTKSHSLLNKLNQQIQAIHAALRGLGIAAKRNP